MQSVKKVPVFPEFTGNSRAKKRTNHRKIELIKQAYSMVAHINRWWCQLRLSSLFYLHQLNFSPCSIRQDTDAVAAILITCLFYQVGHHHHYRCCQSHIWYAGIGPLPLLVIFFRRQRQIHYSEPTVAIPLGVGQRHKFLIPPPLPSSSPLSYLSVARNYIFSLIWRYCGLKRDILEYWGTILYFSS